jgi:DNA repair exonuclease SbcCD ATPase subunit
VVFKRITIQNFFSYGPNKEVLDLSQPGLFLILGENGVGKSAIFDAICFALFGRVTKDVNLPQVVNEIEGKNCRVELWFEVNKVDYWIVRYRAHEKFDDALRLYKGAKAKENLMSKAEKRDTQEIINQIINFNFKSFSNAVMMSQESIASFLEAEPFKKKEIIENILQLAIMTKYHWIAQQKRKAIRKNIETLERDISNLDNMVNSVKQSMVDYVDSCKKQKKEKEDKLIELQKKLQDIENTDIEKELEKIKEAERLALLVDQKMGDYQKVADQLRLIETQRESSENSLLEYRGLIQTNEKRIKELEKQIETVNKEANNIDKTIAEVEENPKICPLCKNTIDTDQVEHWLSEQREKKIFIEETLGKHSDSIDSMNVQIENWKSRSESIQFNIEQLDKQIEEYKKNARTIEKEYKSIVIPETKDEEDLRKLSEEKAKILTEIHTWENKKIIDESYMHTLTNQGSEVSLSMKDKKKSLFEEKSNFAVTEWWENSLSSKKNSMKSWCINNIIGYFNARIKYYMDRFFDGEVTVQMDSELNEKIERKSKDRVFGQFSVGQKRRLNLAILFALYSLVKANISTKINIMFLDEILSNHLDDKGISTVLELLEEMKDNKETVFIIEHREHFKDYPSFKPVYIYKDNSEYSHIRVSE